MVKVTTQEVLDDLQNWSVSEVNQLVEGLYVKFPFLRPVQVIVSQAIPATPAVKVEQTEFRVVLTGFSEDKKIQVIKIVREITGLSLMDSKALVESLPKPVKENLPKGEAESLASKLSDAGGFVTLQ